MSNRTIIGHERQMGYLNQILASGRWAHAYLFYGPEHVGKYTIAIMLARALHCEMFQITNGRVQSGTFENVCGVCGSCRAIAEYRHPAVLVIDLEHTLVSKKEKRSEIPIEDIRELRRRLGFAGDPGQWRVVIINQAEHMSSEAANAFLKLLEEPGERILFFLIAENREALLPTVRSRTQEIFFSLIGDRILENYSTQYIRDKENRREIVQMAYGRPGRLIMLLENKDYYAEEKKISQLISGFIGKKSVFEALECAEKYAGAGDLRRRTITSLLYHLRGRIFKSETGDFQGEISRIKKIIHIASLLETTSVNPRLALEVMMLESIA